MTRANRGAVLLFVLTAAPHVMASPQRGSSSPPSVATLGRSLVPLTGPWRFHVGDNRAWADPDFDDSAWETLDLRAPPDAHDGDVGLSGYVAGWGATGHDGYQGYAWYRLAVQVTVPAGETPALAGPPLVDDAYQLFVDGKLLGSAGDFSEPRPVPYSIQPRVFRLPARAGGDGQAVMSFAFRVWMGPGTWQDPVARDAGGIHIAPALGLASDVEKHVRLQWLETFEGYVVEVIEPALFLVLAAMAGALISLTRSRAPYLWFAAALILTAASRANQALFYWTQLETAHASDLVANVVLVPLRLGASTMAWSLWLPIKLPRRWHSLILGLTAIYVLCQLLIRSWPAYSLYLVSVGLRLSFVPLLAFVAIAGIRAHARSAWLALLALLLTSVGLFARELNALHVPGIWFPWGVGVSRSQFAYVALIPVLFILLQQRLVLLAKRAA